MNNFKILTVAFLFAAFSLTASAAGESAAKPLKSAATMKSEICKRVDNLKLIDFDFNDATVEIAFYVNADGDVAVASVEGECCVANSYVAKMLKDKKMYVAPELQNTRHEIKIRYVVI